jgi:hypothetical protein
MKKIIFALVALVVAAPAMASNVDVTAAQVGTALEAQITYNAPSGLPRAFGLDITVDSGTITGIVGSTFVTGESRPGNRGYGIFPASFNRHIDPNNPNWSDVNYTPLADPCDLPGDTQGGLGTNGITVEMGSLYVGGPNSPLPSGTLCNITVSGGCTVSLALNVGRGGIVMEDGNAPGSINLTGCAVIEYVTVPDVLLLDEAGATTEITNAGLNVDLPITYECNEAEVADEVLAQNPSGGAQVPIDSNVALWVSTGWPVVPPVVNMLLADAVAAINAVADLSVGGTTTDYNSVIPNGNVISTDPAAGPTLCDTAVDIVVCGGPYPPCWAWSPDSNQCWGDSDDSGTVTTVDFGALRFSWYKTYPDPNYNPCADFDRSGQVNTRDFSSLLHNWYKTPIDPNCVGARGMGWPCPSTVCPPGDPCNVYP